MIHKRSFTREGAWDDSVSIRCDWASRAVQDSTAPPRRCDDRCDVLQQRFLYADGLNNLANSRQQHRIGLQPQAKLLVEFPPRRIGDRLPFVAPAAKGITETRRAHEKGQLQEGEGQRLILNHPTIGTVE